MSHRLWDYILNRNIFLFRNQVTDVIVAAGMLKKIFITSVHSTTHPGQTMVFKNMKFDNFVEERLRCIDPLLRGEFGWENVLILQQQKHCKVQDRDFGSLRMS